MASAFCDVIRPFLTLDARLALTLAMPASRNFWLISFSSTLTPLSAHAVAMPLPINPPPTTATHFVALGLRPTSVTPGTAAVEREAKKKWTSPLHARDDTAFANASCSDASPATEPFVTPVSTASRQSQGWGIRCFTRLAWRLAPANTFFAIASSAGSFAESKDAIFRGILLSAMSFASCVALAMS